MDPQTFIRLSIGCLGIRFPDPSSSSPCLCEIRLRGFPVQTASVPYVSSPEESPGANTCVCSFYLQKSDLKSLLAPSCFHSSRGCLEISVVSRRRDSACCGVRKPIGVFRVDVGLEWGEGKPAVLHNGWIGIGRSRQDGKHAAELHLKVKLNPDPRYVFQFEDDTKLSPQVVLLQGSVRQPIFSCKFSHDTDRVGMVDALSSNQEHERRTRKGWKVKIHDLYGSAVAAAFIKTPFVPSSGCDWVAKSNPGAWLIVRPGPESWQPWGKLEAWRERSGRDSICFRFHVLSDVHDSGELLMSEVTINAEKGGEFFIDTDRPVQPGGATPLPSTQSSGDSAAANPSQCGFVMRCRVLGEGKLSKPLVQLALRHVTCIEDAAIFIALAAAVDLSIEACRPFRRKTRQRNNRHSW